MLARECAGEPELHEDVASLLALADGAEALAPLDPARAAELLRACDPGDETRTIGPYRVVETLGQGGMGTVFLAERIEGGFEQQVALKLVKKGMDSEAIVGRFREERRILARLEHSGIARLLDGGMSEDGRPYFAMEYVEGEPITTYAAREGLDVTDRLRLFLQVCDAVQVAHRNLVVHRDLKPSNILVTGEGRAKLVDFGIAKVLETGGEAETGALTRLGMRPLTPEYASPEQVRGEPVSTASDVYGLGVVLFELLAGRLPCEVKSRTSEEIVRAVCDTEPLPASTAAKRSGAEDAERLARRLRGDLDAVLSKALAKEPDRRYSSVEALAEDLRRHLSGEPVQARPPGSLYRTAKFVNRHRAGVALGAALLLALILGLAGTAWQARVAAAERDRARVAAQEARRERDRARQLGAEAREVADFVVGLFRPTELERTPIQEVTAEQLLDAGAARLEGDLEDQPLTRARLMETIGAVYLDQRLLDRAEQQFSGALALREAALGRDAPGLLPALHGLAATYWRQIRYSEAETVLERALALSREGETAEPLATGRCLMLEGNLQLVRGDPAAAEGYYRRARHLLESALGPDDREVAHLLNNLGVALEDQQEWENAAKTHRRALEIRRRTVGPDHPEVAQSLFNLGRVELSQGHAGAARPLLERSLAIRSTTLGDEHPSVAESLRVLARAEVKLGLVESAERRQRQALAILEARLGRHHPETARMQLELATLLHNQNRLDEALHHVELAAPTFTSTPEVPEGDRLRWRALQIELLSRLGRLDDAKQALASAEPTTLPELISGLTEHGLTDEAAHLADLSLPAGSASAPGSPTTQVRPIRWMIKSIRQMDR